MVGNCMLWWRRNGAGYTTDLSQAAVYSLKEALAHHVSRDTDVPWPKGYIDARAAPRVDFQNVRREDVVTS